MKSGYYLLMIILVVGLAGLFIFGGQGTVATGDSGNGNAGTGGNIQKIVLGIQNRNYYPNTITVKEGQTVRISLDSSVVGCYRGFTIRDFGIAKYLKTPDDYIEFTPNKKGTFRFACSMGMGTGTLVVE